MRRSGITKTHTPRRGKAPYLQADVLSPARRLKSESGQVRLKPQQDAAFSAERSRWLITGMLKAHATHEKFTGFAQSPAGPQKCQLQLREARRATKHECLKNHHM